MNAKKLIALLLALAMVMALAACMPDEEGQLEGDLNNDGQIEVGQDGVEVEVNVSDVHMNAAEAFAAGQWEALFTPIDIEGRAIDMLDYDLTPTAEELEAMKNEPAYGQTVLYYMSDGCTSGPTVADDLGYYEQAGLIAEGVKGNSIVEAIGTQQATVAVSHIATLLVPITNGVDMTFVGGAHIGCKSLYVLADSEYETTEDLKGTAISVPNGIGNADYNITCMMLDADGINPQTDVTLTQVSSDACVTAMENGEIAAALFSDSFAYAMVKEGKLRAVRSLLDEDFADNNCCVITMNRTFVEENPVHAKKIIQCVQKAHSFMRENTAEATQYLLDRGWNAGDFDMNVMLNGSMQFGTSDAFTEASLREIVDNYLRLGLITGMDDAEEIMDLAWTPVLDN
ncbi:MAG: ABC transporter substrate-binding protein [Oscillospiraceae bacterium]|nr:ABC transporter substrate-binding protein [Oscillospiraceae bacterium]